MTTKQISSVTPNIGNPNAAGEARAGHSAKAKSAETTARNTVSDFKLDLSTEAKDKQKAHAKALEIAQNTPDVREDKVAALKRKIQEGTYQIDSGKIADGIAREAIMEHLAQTEDR